MEIPNGKLIKTDKPCDICDGQVMTMCTAKRVAVPALYAYNGQEICRTCGVRNNVLGSVVK
jgi:hypothetical protein